jgi:hypothetical protein
MIPTAPSPVGGCGNRALRPVACGTGRSVLYPRGATAIMACFSRHME